MTRSSIILSTDLLGPRPCGPRRHDSRAAVYSLVCVDHPLHTTLQKEYIKHRTLQLHLVTRYNIKSNFGDFRYFQ
jgi:hypothetical protein